MTDERKVIPFPTLPKVDPYDLLRETRESLIFGDLRVPLPLPWSSARFREEGNWFISDDEHLVALFDPDSRTGAIWAAFPYPAWTLHHPIMREGFFDTLVPYYVEKVNQLKPR